MTFQLIVLALAAPGRPLFPQGPPALRRDRRLRLRLRLVQVQGCPAKKLEAIRHGLEK